MTHEQRDEALASLKSEVAALRSSVEVLRDRVDQSRLVERFHELTTVQTEVRELKHVREESDKRHWQFVYIFAGAMASLLVTVIVQLVLAAVKK